MFETLPKDGLSESWRRLSVTSVVAPVIHVTTKVRVWRALCLRRAFLFNAVLRRACAESGAPFGDPREASFLSAL
jgi:hypothetical protein